MKPVLAIIHTTPVTIPSLKELAIQYLGDIKIINLLDDSILPQLLENGGRLEEVENRLIGYATSAEEAGATIILNACSSVGEVVAKMREKVSIPVVRIDEAMAESAISKGNKIGVIATLPTTLNPTLKLLQEKAEGKGDYQFNSVLANEAYQKLMEGKPEEHDQILAIKLQELAEQSDVVVLAQASMAKAVRLLPEEIQPKFFTSPELGMQRVVKTIKGE